MKRYMNKAEKNQLGVFVHFQTFLENFLATQKQLKRPTKWYSTGLTFLVKATKEMLAELDPKEIDIAFKQIEKVHLVLRTTDEALKDIQKMKEADELVPLDNNSFLTICSFAFGTCLTCISTEYQTCTLRAIFMEYDIEPVYEQCDGCQYTLNRLKENACFNLYEFNGLKFRVQPGMTIPGFTLLQEAPLPQEHWKYPKVTI